VPRDQRDGSLRLCSRLFRTQPLLFLPVARQLYSRGWVYRVPDALLLTRGIDPWPLTTRPQRRSNMLKLSHIYWHWEKERAIMCQKATPRRLTISAQNERTLGFVASLVKQLSPQLQLCQHGTIRRRPPAWLAKWFLRPSVAANSYWATDHECDLGAIPRISLWARRSPFFRSLRRQSCAQFNFLIPYKTFVTLINRIEQYLQLYQSDMGTS
jgi:hypothetical protein